MPINRIRNEDDDEPFQYDEASGQMLLHGQRLRVPMMMRDAATVGLDARRARPDPDDDDEDDEHSGNNPEYTGVGSAPARRQRRHQRR